MNQLAAIDGELPEKRVEQAPSVTVVDDSMDAEVEKDQSSSDSASSSSESSDSESDSDSDSDGGQPLLRVGAHM